jgi:hypothetical protein
MKTKIKIDLQGKSKTLQKLAEKHSNKFDEVYWEEDHGFWFHLKGYHKEDQPHGCDDDTCSHIIRYDTVKEILEAFKEIKPCFCQLCKTT